MRKTMIAVGAVACVLLPALAFAALPKKDADYRYCDRPNNCPLTFHTSGTGRKVKELNMYNRCATLPAEYPGVRVKDTGRFSKSGTVEDVLSNEVDFTIKGKFKRAKKAVGTFELDGGSKRNCDADPEEFVAKFVPPAE
jgi:hypothetical protein